MTSDAGSHDGGNGAGPSSKGAAEAAANAKAVLQRGRACLNCRKKKLRCDAVHPHCAPCLKSHKQHLATLPPDALRPPYPECVWDDDKPEKPSGEKRRRTVDGSKGKGSQLEAMESKIAELERQLKQVGSAPPEGLQMQPDPTPGLPPGPSFNLAQYPFAGPTSQGYQQYHQPYAQQVQQQQQLHQQSSVRTEQPTASTSTANIAPPNDFLPAFSFGPGAPAAAPLAPTPAPAAFPYAHPFATQYQQPPPAAYDPLRHDSASSSDSSTRQQNRQPPPFFQHESQSSGTGPSSVHSGTNVSSPRESAIKAAASAAGAGGYTSGSPSTMDPPSTGSGPYGGVGADKGPIAPAGTDYDEAALENESFFHSLIYPSYPKTLPPPSLLYSLVETFFTKVPTVHKALHKTQFLTSLHSYPPSHPSYPHPSVLHAICALASRHSGRTEVFSGSTPDWSAPPLSDTLDPDSFGAKHAEYAKTYMEEEFKKGERLFDALIACVILTAFDYQNARWVQVWLSSALCCRLAVPLGVNESAKGRNYIPGSKPSLLPKTDDDLEREQRRRVFWLGFMSDRMAAASSGWAGSLDEADIGAELPTKLVHFLRGTDIPENPQTLGSPDLFTYHPPDCTDSFVLHLKSLTLLSRVKQFNRRFLKPPQWPETKIPDPRATRAFQTVQDQVEKYRSGFPKEFKDPIRGMDGDGGTGIDGDLFLAHLIPFVAMIVLHENHVDLMNKDDPSSKMMLTAARGMLSTIFLLLSTSYDLASLHPFSAFCFFAGGRAVTRFYQAALFVGDERAAKAAMSEIEVFRSVLSKFGEKIPLAHRQLQMLDMSIADAQGFPAIPASAAASECPIYEAGAAVSAFPPRSTASPASAMNGVQQPPQQQYTSDGTFVTSQVIMDTFHLFPAKPLTSATPSPHPSASSSPSTNPNLNAQPSPSAPFTPSAYFQPPPPTPPPHANPAQAAQANGYTQVHVQGVQGQGQPPNPAMRVEQGMGFGGASGDAIRKLFEEFETEEGGGFGGMWGSEGAVGGGGGRMEWS